MPTYDYGCAKCGGFTALRPMSERNDPLFCPECGGIASRELGSAPAFAGMSPVSRAAHATNERAANEPTLSSRLHGRGCGCCAGSSSSGNNAANKQRPGSLKGFGSKRPWMISH